MVVGYTAQSPQNSAIGAQNSAAIIQSGNVLLRQNKMLLPTYDVFDEARYFLPGERTVHLHDRRHADCARHLRRRVERQAVLGAAPVQPRPYRRTRGARRRPDHHDQRLALEHRESGDMREAIFRATAARFRLPQVYAHMVGGNDQLVFDGSSFAMTADGEVAAQAKSFEEDLICFDSTTGKGDLHANHKNDDEAAYEALVLGTRDYIRKCGFRSVLIGLSGGIDSALVAALAVEAVGKENVTGVGMPGPYSSSP